MVCSSNFHKKTLHLGMGYSKCSNSVVDKLSILTYPIFDTGNVWNWATEVHRCCLAPASRVAYNVPLHVHSHQLGTPCVLTLLSLSLSCVRELLVVLYKDNSRDVNNNRGNRSEEHTSELQSHSDLVCRLLLEKKKKKNTIIQHTKYT